MVVAVGVEEEVLMEVPEVVVAAAAVVEAEVSVAMVVVIVVAVEKIEIVGVVIDIVAVIAVAPPPPPAVVEAVLVRAVKLELGTVRVSHRSWLHGRRDFPQCTLRKVKRKAKRQSPTKRAMSRRFRA